MCCCCGSRLGAHAPPTGAPPASPAPADEGEGGNAAYDSLYEETNALLKNLHFERLLRKPSLDARSPPSEEGAGAAAAPADGLC